MSRKIPKLNVDRTSDTSADLTFPNWSNEEVFIYRAVGQSNQFELLTSVTAGSYTDSTLEAGKHYKYYIRMTDLVSSVQITADNSDQTPPYFTAENILPSTFADVTHDYNYSWTATRTVPFIRISNLQEGLSSIGKFTT